MERSAVGNCNFFFPESEDMIGAYVISVKNLRKCRNAAYVRNDLMAMKKSRWPVVVARAHSQSKDINSRKHGRCLADVGVRWKCGVPRKSYD